MPKSYSEHTSRQRDQRSIPMSKVTAGKIAGPKHADKKGKVYKPRMQQRIEQVQALLADVLKFHFPADSTLSKWFREHKFLGVQDRAQIAEAVYDILRHLRRYRHFAQSGQGPELRRLAILGLQKNLGIKVLNEVLTDYERDWLSHVEKIDNADFPLSLRYSLPEWLAEQFAVLPQAEALMDAFNQQASLDLRVNPLKVERSEALVQMQASPYIEAQPQATPYSPWGIRVVGRPALNNWSLFEKGMLEVQDEGSQLLCLLVAPKRTDIVIDFCAGAGGKTLLLGAMMRSAGRLYAFDVSAARLAKAKPRLVRGGLSNVTPIVISHENDSRVKRLAGKAQRVLVDAPCSGVGTLRRNPDLKWRQNPQTLAELVQLQRRILQSASRCVAPGGRLVYSTCSLLPQENEQQIANFLQNNPDFELLNAYEAISDRVTDLQSELVADDTTGNAEKYLRLRPDMHGTDGFFAALLQRKSA